MVTSPGRSPAILNADDVESSRCTEERFLQPYRFPNLVFFGI